MMIKYKFYLIMLKRKFRNQWIGLVRYNIHNNEDIEIIYNFISIHNNSMKLNG